jgi:penicillin-binding protein 1A
MPARKAASSCRKTSEEADKLIETALLDREESSGFLPAVVLAWKFAHPGALAQRRRCRTGRQRNQIRSTLFVRPDGCRQALARGSIVRVARIDPECALAVDLSATGRGRLSLRSRRPMARYAPWWAAFDFSRNQFNHVTQAWRQAGSSFKPFVYSAALERGITPASVFDGCADRGRSFRNRRHQLVAEEL